MQEQYASLRIHKVLLDPQKKSRTVCQCWDCQSLLALASAMQNAGGPVIPNWCSLLNTLSTELNEQNIFLIFDFLGRG